MRDTTKVIAGDMVRRAIGLANMMPRAMGCDARDSSGHCCNVTSSDAVQLSILGMVFRAACGMGFVPDAPPEANGELHTACKLACDTLNDFSRSRFGRTIQDLNDDPKTSLMKVVYVLMMAQEIIGEFEPAPATEDA